MPEKASNVSWTMLKKKKNLANYVCVVTTSGLLSLEDSDHSVIMNKNLDSPAIANVPAMTTESQATSFRLFTGTLQAQTTRGTFYNTLRPSRGPPPALINNKEHRSANMFQSHRRHFQPVLRGPEHRVLLISRLHYDANRNSVELFFQGFRIVDFKRKYNSTAFVLFESVEDRDRARYLKNGQKLLGREVILNIATRGVRVSNNGFLPGNAAEIALSPLAYGAQWPGSGFPSAPAMKLLDNPDSEADRSTHGPQKRAQAHTSTNDLEQADLTMYTARQVISETQVQGYNQAPQNYPDVGFGIPMSLHEMLNQAYIHTNIQRTRRLLGPWNIAGKNSEDKRYNMITENEWYGRQ